MPEKKDKNLVEEEQKEPEEEEVKLPDIYKTLVITLTQFGIREVKARGIVELFMSYDEKNFAKLDDIMRLAGIASNTRQLVLEKWANLVGVKPEEIPKLIEQQRKTQVEEAKQEPTPTEIKEEKEKSIQDIERIVEDMNAKMLEQMKSQLALATLAQRLQALGIDPAQFGIIIPTKKKEEENDDDPVGEFEFPPGSGQMLKMRHSKYAKLMIEWNAKQGEKVKKETEDEEDPIDEFEYPPGSGKFLKMRTSKYARLITEWNAVQKAKKEPEEEKMVPWEDPITHKIVQVPASQYHYYVDISRKYQEDPEKKELLRKLEDMQKKLDEKEKQDLYGYLDALQKKLKELENKDELEETERSIKKLKETLERLGYAPRETSIKEEALLKKLDVQTEVIKDAMDVVKEQSKKVGSVVRSMAEAVTPVIQQQASKMLQQAQISQQGQVPSAVPPAQTQLTPEQLAELERSLEAEGKVVEDNMPKQVETKKEEGNKEGAKKPKDVEVK